MNKRRLGLLTGTHAVNDLYQGLVPALLPFMVLERGYSYTAVSGLMLAATGLSSVVQPLFGLYADRHPRSWLVPTGFLVAARAAGGASQKAMSVFSVGGTIGASFAPVLAATVVGGGGLARSYLLSLPALAMGVVWVLVNAGRGSASAATAAAARKAGGEVLKPHNDWRAFGWLVATIVGWSIPYVTVLSMLSLRITRDLHGTSFQGAAALTGFTAAGAVGVLLGGWLGDRLGRMGTIRAGYLLALPALAGLVLAPSAGWALVCTALLGMSMFLPFAAQVTLAQDYLPRNPATASGITLGLALSVGGLVSPLFGMLSDARGLGVTFTAVLCVLGVATGLALRLRNRAVQVVVGAQGAAA